MAAVVEVPPSQCGRAGCGETELRPGWGECPRESPEGRCRKMDRDYRCANNHVTMATWHVHRIVPPDRPRSPGSGR